MKRSALIFVFAVITGFNLFADEIPREEWKNMSRQERKAYREEQAVKQKTELLNILNEKQWVLEAYNVRNKEGETFQIEPHLNFVGVVNENATVQLGSSSDIGLNGVGGITLDGRVTKYEIMEGKKATSGVTVKLYVSSSAAGHMDMILHISPNGSASATVSDQFGERITYSGHVVVLGESKVFKGQTIL